LGGLSLLSAALRKEAPKGLIPGDYGLSDIKDYYFGEWNIKSRVSLKSPV
jgi:hypothetical protein